MTNKLNRSYDGRVEGKHTFFWVLDTYWEEIFSACNDEVRDSYALTYNNKILPKIGNLPVDGCTEEVLSSTLVEITSTQAYSDRTIERFKNLMSRVVDFAVDVGICKNALYGTAFHTEKSVTRETILKNELQQNRKSLSPKEEVAILKRTLLPLEDTKGTDVGLLCMLAMGLRNHEACGLTWEAIRPLDSSGSVYVAWIYESTVGQTSNLQASGKTKNMARKVPLYPGFAKYLLALKAYRKQQIEEGVIVLEEGESLETLPIVWREKNFKQHCTSGGLSAAGRHLLAEINFGQDRFAALDEDLGEIAAMEEADNDEEWVSLKDPTAYLLRRNFGTHLSVLGFSDDEISYLMGHKIDTDGRNRNMFSNEDQLKIIFRKLNMRPLFGNNDDAKPNQRLSPDIPLIKLDNVWGASITAVAKEKSKAFVRVSLREPDDEATITVKKDPAGTATPISARIYPLPPCVDTETSPMVNNIRMYQEAYRKVRGTKKLFDAF